MSSAMAVEHPVSTAIAPIFHGAMPSRETLCSIRETAMSVLSAALTAAAISWSSTVPAARTMWWLPARKDLLPLADPFTTVNSVRGCLEYLFWDSPCLF